MWQLAKKYDDNVIPWEVAKYKSIALNTCAKLEVQAQAIEKLFKNKHLVELLRKLQGEVGVFIFDDNDKIPI